ncbi:nuclear transport factor 2 family protein [Pseudonocardia acidicola]|uniref:Nuclear transport factor 2 family protein n=1 Tax=Pseudonocardia acidicola TaxID=2724939 RepID=A0ABX1SCM5_9PSEU|nr:nuclear transport factor 2 family protein [Pseudonocardia acidicola]NMH98253.1 nuclear transport factor 2 family protein [Pseudonocardia acidicola]
MTFVEGAGPDRSGSGDHAVSPEEYQAVVQVLHRYCRGVDRMDAGLTRSCFTPDAELVYGGVYRGEPAGFVDWLWPVHAAMIAHSHDVTNVIVDRRPDGSLGSEAYVVVTLRIDDGGEVVDLVSHGRYLDEWTLGRDPRITRRRYVSTLSAARPVTPRDLSRHFRVGPGAPVLRAARDAADPSYDLFAGEAQ